MTNTKSLKVYDANALYLIGAILFFTIGFYAQNLNLKLGLIITQYILILLPPIIYLMIKKMPLKTTLRLNKIKFKHALLVGIITILMYPTAVFANALFMTLMSLLGNLNIPELPSATNPREYIILMLIISISAGICEEVFFRGFILSGYERLGAKRAIVISSILFGVFHFNLYNLFGPIVLGLVFSYLVLLTNSLYAGIIGHIVNNGFAVTLGYMINRFMPLIEENQDAAVEQSTTVALFFSVVFFGVVAVGAGLLALKLINIIKRDYSIVESQSVFTEENEVIPNTTQPKEFIPLLFVAPLFILVVFIQLAEIISLG
ncbi:MAG: CPBP family intramembrane metalloprotease [Clostridiaceae bacterium]|nr:CPBP family intramembrane metalloprotease [Clostridiaceae bacterium]